MQRNRADLFPVPLKEENGNAELLASTAQVEDSLGELYRKLQLKLHSSSIMKNFFSTPAQEDSPEAHEDKSNDHKDPSKDKAKRTNRNKLQRRSTTDSRTSMKVKTKVQRANHSSDLAYQRPQQDPETVEGSDAQRKPGRDGSTVQPPERRDNQRESKGTKT